MQIVPKAKAASQPPDYLADYIRRALTSDKLEAPDQTKVAHDYESLVSLYEAHALGGVKAAWASWAVIQRLRPELTQYDPNRIPKLIHADRLKELSSPMYLLDYYAIYQFGFNVLVGASGCGKSFIALDIAGRISKERAVVYIAGEGLHGYAARWEAWKDFNKGGGELYFYTDALQVMDNQQLSEFIGLISEHDPALVIIDTLARSAVGVEENSAKEMGGFVGACDALRGALHTSVLVVHHTGKSGDIRGSSALYGAADSVLSAKNVDGVVSLFNEPDSGGKNKHASAAATKYFKIVPHTVGDYAGAVLMETQYVMVGLDDALTANQQKIVDCIHDYGDGVDAQTIIETTGIKQPTVYRNLSTLVASGYLKYRDSKYTIKEDVSF